MSEAQLTIVSLDSLKEKLKVQVLGVIAEQGSDLINALSNSILDEMLHGPRSNRYYTYNDGTITEERPRPVPLDSGGKNYDVNSDPNTLPGMIRTELGKELEERVKKHIKAMLDTSFPYSPPDPVYVSAGSGPGVVIDYAGKVDGFVADFLLENGPKLMNMMMANTVQQILRAGLNPRGY